MTKNYNVYDFNMKYDEEIQKPYYQSLVDLLDKYEDGWNLFIKANQAKSYSIPLVRKPEHEDDPYLPKTWLELADRVTEIIATQKYKLDTNPNRIEIVRADQMLDAYVKPVPDGPAHWPNGKRRFQEQQKYDKNHHLAFEIIINSNPALAYCMEDNSPLMQLLVFAHASQGHNAFYKGNYLFDSQTHPEIVLTANKRLKELEEECSEKYGVEEVERVLDFCASMQFMDTSFSPHKKYVSESELKKQQEEARQERFFRAPPKKKFNDMANDNEVVHHEDRETNILQFIAENCDHIPQWKREMMMLSSVISQNFHPNSRTNVNNEGFACTTHIQVLETMHAIGLIDADMYVQLWKTHPSVTFQPPGFVYRQHPMTGEEVKVLTGQDMNIYALGFEIYMDVKRICERPTEEDERWFPHIAGKGNWEDVCLELMQHHSNETLIRNYMSPTVMRKFKFFMLEGDMRDEFLEVSAIHTDEGYEKIREQLASDYRYSDVIPKVSKKDYQYETDRCLIMRHEVINEQRLEPKSLQQILEMIHYHTKKPVVMESIENGKVVATYSSPPNYDYKAHSPELLRRDM